MKGDGETRFAFRLALALGCTVRELLQRIDSEELTLWHAYYNLEPWGEERADIRAAIVASTTANCFSTKRHKLTDFLPKWEKPEPQSWEVSQAYFAALSKRADGI